MRRTLVAALAAAALGASEAPRGSGAETRFVTYRLDVTGFEADPGATDDPLPMGSLLKPFVAKAWAVAHPGESPPHHVCAAGGGCWVRSGHGEVGISRALAVSCNTYFLRLAAATPTKTLADTFAAEGFRVGGTVTPEVAIGLPSSSPPISVRPSVMLLAYARLVRSPWAAGEEVRQDVLAGLREAALTGTAGALGRRGYWAKTGTVGALDGNPLRTTGFVVAVDDVGFAILAVLDPGTGREAARAVAAPLSRLRPWTASREPSRQDPDDLAPNASRTDRSSVTLRLFDLLSPAKIGVKNLGLASVPSSHGYVGPGALFELRPGDRLGPGLLEVHEPETGLSRRFEGTLSWDRAAGGRTRLTASMAAREYVAGVILAELPDPSPSRRVELGAAVLRFLRSGPRHGPVDVCDTTHCGWFVGRGPRVAWAAPKVPVLLNGPAGSREPEPFDDPTWQSVLAAARIPGPSQWTSHCGGRALSPHAVWGSGDTSSVACPRHGPDTRPWSREWTAAALGDAFGAPVRGMSVVQDKGVWTLEVELPNAKRRLRYDEAHRVLSRVLGWGALPSPADRVESIPGGFRAAGVGLGHRVGLCLAD